MTNLKDEKKIDLILSNKFKDYFENIGFMNFPTGGIVDEKNKDNFKERAGLTEVSSIISKKAISDKISWINISPVFKYDVLSRSMVSKWELAFYDALTFFSATPTLDMRKKSKRNIVEEINYLYSKKIKTKIQREKVYEEFIKFSKDEKLPIGHDYILSEEFFDKFLYKKQEDYRREIDEVEKEKKLYKYVAVLSMVRMTQKFNQRFEIYGRLFSFLEEIGIEKDRLRFTIHGGGHPVSDFEIPEEVILKEVLMKSFDIKKENIFKLANENTLEFYYDEKNPQIGTRSQIFYEVINKDKNNEKELIELGVASFSEYFLDYKDKTVKFSENFVSRFSFGLQRLNMVFRIENGQNVKIDDVSVFGEIIAEIKKFLKENREYYTDSPYIFEKREISKLGQVLISTIILLIEKVDIESSKESKKYFQFNEVMKNLGEMFFEFHFFDKKKNNKFIHKIIDRIIMHYGELYPEIYKITDSQKEDIVKKMEQIIVKIKKNRNYGYLSIVNQDWK